MFLPLPLNFLNNFTPLNRECPPELREAISSIIFSAPRCSEVPDLLQIKNLFTAKYGKEFMAAASELRPDSGVNRTVKWFYWICNFESAEAAVIIVKKTDTPFSIFFIYDFCR